MVSGAPPGTAAAAAALPTLTVISPHRDDAALSLAATLDALAARGAAITVVSCFTHSAWAPRLAGPLEAEAVSAAREREDAAYVATLGRGARLVSLGLDDAPLRRPAETVFEPVGALDAPAAHDLLRLLAEAAAAAAWVAPLALGGHVDHRLTRDAAAAACRGRPLAWYEDLPYAFALSDREIAAEVAALQARHGLRLRPLRIPHPRPLAVWQAGVACYPTQFAVSEIGEMADVQRTRGGERLWVGAGFMDWLLRCAPPGRGAGGPGCPPAPPGGARAARPARPAPARPPAR